MVEGYMRTLREQDKRLTQRQIVHVDKFLTDLKSQKGLVSSREYETIFGTHPESNTIESLQKELLGDKRVDKMLIDKNGSQKS